MKINILPSSVHTTLGSGYKSDLVVAMAMSLDGKIVFKKYFPSDSSLMIDEAVCNIARKEIEENLISLGYKYSGVQSIWFRKGEKS